MRRADEGECGLRGKCKPAAPVPPPRAEGSAQLKKGMVSLWVSGRVLGSGSWDPRLEGLGAKPLGMDA